MVIGFLVFIAGIVLILLSYLSLKFATSVKSRIEKNKEQTKPRIQDGFLIPTRIEALEVFRYVFGSVVLFVMGIIFVVLEILTITGKVQVSY